MVPADASQAGHLEKAYASGPESRP